jgi:hypothetical protein
MSVETQRKNIVHRILGTQNSKLLSQIEELLDNDVYAYTRSGKPLSVQEYKVHLDEIMMASDAGEIGYSTNEAKAKISRK